MVFFNKIFKNLSDFLILLENLLIQYYLKIGKYLLLRKLWLKILTIVKYYVKILTNRQKLC